MSTGPWEPDRGVQGEEASHGRIGADGHRDSVSVVDAGKISGSVRMCRTSRSVAAVQQSRAVLPSPLLRPRRRLVMTDPFHADPLANSRRATPGERGSNDSHVAVVAAVSMSYQDYDANIRSRWGGTQVLDVGVGAGDRGPGHRRGAGPADRDHQLLRLRWPDVDLRRHGPTREGLHQRRQGRGQADSVSFRHPAMGVEQTTTLQSDRPPRLRLGWDTCGRPGVRRRAELDQERRHHQLQRSVLGRPHQRRCGGGAGSFGAEVAQVVLLNAW